MQPGRQSAFACFICQLMRMYNPAATDLNQLSQPHLERGEAAWWQARRGGCKPQDVKLLRKFVFRRLDETI